MQDLMLVLRKLAERANFQGFETERLEVMDALERMQTDADEDAATRHQVDQVDQVDQADQAGTYDPAEHTVEEVNDYVTNLRSAGNELGANRVLTNERMGLNRKGIKR